MNNELQKDLAAYKLRVQGFLMQGYHVVFTADLPNMLFTKICNKKGKRLSIYYAKDDGRISFY